MNFTIGVDGGGTWTRVVVVDQDGCELGRGETEGAVVTAHQPVAAAQAIQHAINSALVNTGLSTPGNVLWAGMSGAGSDESHNAIKDALVKLRVAERIIVNTDVEVAFHDAFGFGPGIMLVAGTGSIAWARQSDHTEVRIGGWGQHIGDEGSGYQIGIGALRCITRSEDGRDRPTALRDYILRHLDLEDVQELVGWTAMASKREIAALAPFVSQTAAKDDPAAKGIFQLAVQGCLEHLKAILKVMGPWVDPPAVALWGGLLRSDGLFRDEIIRAVKDHGLKILDRDLDPALGAARLALEEGLSNRQ
jgi:N-acetylglucosamine kinase-like BadF-type ATPase